MRAKPLSMKEYSDILIRHAIVLSEIKEGIRDTDRSKCDKELLNTVLDLTEAVALLTMTFTEVHVVSGEELGAIIELPISGFKN